MSYDRVLTSLKGLLRHELYDLEPKEHRALIEEQESDRASIILLAALIERSLVRALKELMPSINNEERDRIFQFEGPCGSFSNRIRMAHALGLIDRPMRRKFDLVREMRNVAAHAHPDINFATPEIREAAITLLDEKYRDIARGLPAKELRCAIVNYSAKLVYALKGEEPKGLDDYFYELRERYPPEKRPRGEAKVQKPGADRKAKRH